MTTHDKLFEDDRAPVNLDYIGVPARRQREIQEIIQVRPDGLIKRNKPVIVVDPTIDTDED